MKSKDVFSLAGKTAWGSLILLSYLLECKSVVIYKYIISVQEVQHGITD